MVNNPGKWEFTYPTLKHAEWDGLTLADFVFPFFLFIMGCSAWLSISSQVARGVSKGVILRKAAIRSGKLFAIGIGIGLFWDHHLATFRILGVLQRIGIVNLVVAAFALYVPPRGWLAYAVAILIGVLVLFKLAPQPDQGNWYAWLDHHILGEHAYRGTFPLDAEGILSTLPAVATALLGLWVGRRQQLEGLGVLERLLPVGIGLMAFAATLHFTGLNPINKMLWSPAFVAATGGAAIVLLALAHMGQHVPGVGAVQRALIPVGLNPIAIYVMAELSEHLINQKFNGLSMKHRFMLLVNYISPHLCLNSLLWPLTLIAFWVIVAHVLYRRKVFFKV